METSINQCQTTVVKMTLPFYSSNPSIRNGNMFWKQFLAYWIFDTLFIDTYTFHYLSISKEMGVNYWQHFQKLCNKVPHHKGYIRMSKIAQNSVKSVKKGQKYFMGVSNWATFTFPIPLYFPLSEKISKILRIG